MSTTSITAEKVVGMAIHPYSDDGAYAVRAAYWATKRSLRRHAYLVDRAMSKEYFGRRSGQVREATVARRMADLAGALSLHEKARADVRAMRRSVPTHVRRAGRKANVLWRITK